jgi:hypothetical protein
LLEVGEAFGGAEEGFGVDAGFVGLFNLEWHTARLRKHTKAR